MLDDLTASPAPSESDSSIDDEGLLDATLACWNAVRPTIDKSEGGRAVAVSPSGEYRLDDSLEAAQAALADGLFNCSPNRVFVDRFMREQARSFYSKPDAPE